MRPVFRSSSCYRALIAGAVLLGALTSVGCEGGGATSAPAAGAATDPFSFLRTREAVVRTNSSTGQVWFAGFDGDGGWLDLGTAPDAGAQASRPGRYSVIPVTPPQKGPTTMGRNQEILLMRLDGDTGRAWIAQLRRSAEWQEIKDAG